MSADKIEPRLQNLAGNERLRASLLGVASDEIDQQAFDVIISHAEPAEAAEDPSEDDRPAAVEQLHSQILQSQAPILARLDQIGAPAERTVHQLANAVSTRLTLPQMTALSELDEVALIRSDAPEMVTCINETGRVAMRPPEAGALAALRRFNYERIYTQPASVAQADAVIAVLRALVEHYAEHPEHLPGPDQGEQEPSPVRRAVTYVGGMTDRYAFETARTVLGWDPARLPRGIDVPGRS